MGGDVLDGSMVDLAVPCLMASRWRWLRRFTMPATKGSFATCYRLFVNGEKTQSRVWHMVKSAQVEEAKEEVE